MAHLHWTWDVVDTASRCISNWATKECFVPDIVIGIARGGWIPARLVADHLNVRTLLSLQVHYYRRGQTSTIQAPEVLINLPLRSVDKTKRVLIIDDIYDSGKTLATVVKYVAAKGVVKYRIATLATKLPIEQTQGNLHFAAMYTPNSWVVFPWDSREYKEE